MATRFSFQLYSARNFPPTDDVLGMLARAGYGEVEGYGGVYQNPKALRARLDELDLTMPTGHFSIEMMEEKPAQVLKIARTLGMNQLIVPWLDPDARPTSAKDWKEFGKRLNAIARTFRAEGLGVSWHNHDFEFMPLKGDVTPITLIFEAAPLLDWEIDVAWLVRAKTSPLTWIKHYADIITAAHVKDIARKGENMDEDGWTIVGEGIVKWAAVFEALSNTRCMHRVIEHDNPKDLETFARKSLKGAQKLVPSV